MTGVVAASATEVIDSIDEKETQDFDPVSAVFQRLLEVFTDRLSDLTVLDRLDVGVRGFPAVKSCSVPELDDFTAGVDRGPPDPPIRCYASPRSMTAVSCTDGLFTNLGPGRPVFV